MPDTKNATKPAEPATAAPAAERRPTAAAAERKPATPATPPAAAPERKLAAPAQPKSGWWWGTGRRKRAMARVRLRPAQSGEGKVLVQIDSKKTKTIEQYFAEDRDRNDCYSPLKATSTMGRFDVVIRVNGGGFMGQAGAVKLGIARALKGYDPTTEATLRDNGMLTRDSREVERKKYGQAGARRRFQFSKR